MTPTASTASTRLLFSDDFVEVFCRDGSSDYTLVTFSSIGIYADGFSYWGRALADRLDLRCVGIMARAAHWFPRISMARCLPAIRQVLRRRVVTFGHSMGGYGAIKYSGELGANTVLAFSPQTTLSPDEIRDNAYSTFFDADLHADMSIKAEDVGGVVYLFHDPFCRDDRKQIAFLPPSEKFRPVPVTSLGHETIQAVVGSGVAADLFRRSLDGDEDGIAALVRAGKRRSAATAEELAIHLVRRRKHRWATMALGRAQAMRPSDKRIARFARERSLVLEQDGDREAAARTLRDGIAEVGEVEPLLIRLAENLSASGACREAVDAFRRAIAVNGSRAATYHGLVNALVKAGRRAEAPDAIDLGLTYLPEEPSLLALRNSFPTATPIPSTTGATMSHALMEPHTPARSGSSKPAPFAGRAPEGPNYQFLLGQFHETFRPDTYLEIGVHEGATLKLSRARTIAIDPCFRAGQLPAGNQPVCCLYQMTSDAFFRDHDPTSILGRPVDMAFLDGMHWFEFLLRDFINTEKHCRSNSVVFLHDCLPLDAHVGRRLVNDDSLQARSAAPGWWAGDVWKTLLILERYRPDLRIVLFDAAPTGLVAITGLDPQSTILSERYFDLVDEFKDRSLLGDGRVELDRLPVLETARHSAHDALSSLFWL